MTHLEVYWELPQFRRYCERLAEFTRLILFDKRGMGMSDRVPGATTLEERMDDIRAIMDAVGSERAAVMGESEGGPLAMLFAAAHPERTVALILQGAEVRERTDDEWPWGESTEEAFEEAMATHRRSARGRARRLTSIAPSVGGRSGRARGGTRGGHACSDTGLGRGVHAHGLRHRRSPRRACDQRADAGRPRARRPGLPRRERTLPRSNDPRSTIRRARHGATTCLVRSGRDRSPRSASS